MAKSLTFYWTLLWFFILGSASAGQFTAESGQDVTLTCRAPNYNIIIVVEWSRADLGSEYVLLYRDDQFDPEQQHPSFKNRVDLQDRQMINGDVSLILKNVTVNDTGTYECRVFHRGADLHSDSISTIYLRVSPPPGPGGGATEDGGKQLRTKDVALIIGVTVAALVLAASVAVLGILSCKPPHFLDLFRAEL